MAETIHKAKPRGTEEYTDQDRQQNAEAIRQRAGHTAVSAEDKAKREAETDEVLKDIDEVLEVNAEEFVRQYVQKGGE